MSDQHLLRDTVQRAFAGLGDQSQGHEAWAVIDSLDLMSLVIGEESGGFGGSWDDARIVFRACGYFAMALPLPEAILANYIGKRAGASGRGSIASRTQGHLDRERFTGEIGGAVDSEGAAFIVAPLSDGGALVVATAGGERQDALAMSDLRREAWRFESARAVRVDVDVYLLGAFARACQIAGALDAALALSVAHANHREQFGRPLAKFQTLQQSLATFACEAAAVNCASAGAAQALDAGGGAFEIAAAKLRANRAVGIGTSVAHQTHGAIGFTQEYELHQLTRRLWAWRSEFGGDAHWSAILGQRVLDAGADAFWTNLSGI